MAQWETCEINVVMVKERKDYIFKFIPATFRCEAHKITPSGPEVLFQSKEYQFHGTMSFEDKRWEKQRKEEDAAYHEVIAYLSSKGWEPAATDGPNGKISLMKRQISRESTVTAHAKINPADLLQQLAALRDAGALTEQEFQDKKAEILKRM